MKTIVAYALAGPCLMAFAQQGERRRRQDSDTRNGGKQRPVNITNADLSNVVDRVNARHSVAAVFRMVCRPYRRCA